ncbi:hypothetical protein QP794_19990 [Paenibacillus sp. UMB7766-LJ446]|uniref:hypothetical protein n=1 Tax=Paenibacillus sp. UMB7766-LJ446 TaxID=3046313 RepID=UPI00254BE1F3|nr:hypothetical protein [Paenibacillus sp. UMB7766-LJ446]MDK8192368.1 hypothetical protein [Paenibacillus sp. UMB7766-LJ446]
MQHGRCHAGPFSYTPCCRTEAADKPYPHGAFRSKEAKGRIGDSSTTQEDKEMTSKVTSLE